MAKRRHADDDDNTTDNTTSDMIGRIGQSCRNVCNVRNVKSRIDNKNNDMILKLGGAWDWKRRVYEVVRIGRNIMSTLPACAFRDIERWERTVHIDITNHARARMHEYINKPSKHNDYIEMYESEYDYLINPKNIESLLRVSKRVEIGFDSFARVCKIGYTVALDRYCPFLYSTQEQRCLFICLGIDGYVRTLNITPREKTRQLLGGKNGYLNHDELRKFICDKSNNSDK